MEPNLITKYKRYLNKKKKGKIKSEARKNDSGVSYEDLRSNDMWSLGFLLLLTHNPNFAYCYKYRLETSDDSLIEFDSKLYVKLFRKFCRRNETDKNLIYVLQQMMGFRKFEGSRRLTFRRKNRRAEHHQGQRPQVLHLAVDVQPAPLREDQKVREQRKSGQVRRV